MKISKYSRDEHDQLSDFRQRSTGGVLLVRLTKTVPLFTILIFLSITAPSVHAIADPTAIHQDLEKRIGEIKNSRSQVAESLGNANLTKQKRKQLEEWGKSLDEEQKVLEKRLELFRKLQESGIITYINPVEKKEPNNDSEEQKRTREQEIPN